MLFRARNVLISGTVGVLAAAIGIPLAVAGESPSQRVAADVPPVAVEDFNYPGAADILVTKGITLKRGDGHVLLADCDTALDQIRVYTVKDDAAGRDGNYCFQATAKTGYVTLEVPRVFGLETGAHPISADLTANGETTTVAVAKDIFKSVGEGTVGGARSVLVEIRVTG
ncbi:hypothetical protein P1S61_40490 [Streptomyces sp. ME08-AFT2]|uniref:hypothetical protein n=1 Tax=Streptomyces sp. ME08-AFT2 TaxID=3028683 RepID=UPI0029BCDA50|nr:hypothetical protein [Streptomyces sp. ME08-AFT2]MDX3315217.1 hypothetical protein [Streptomyces sp. ME08-AFT2]